MALVICKGCNRAVSKYNETCPYCGVPVGKSVSCPKCNSTKFEKYGKRQLVLNLFVKRKPESFCVCKDCGKKFRID